MQRLLVTLIFVCFVTNIDARITCSQWLKEKGECTKFTGNYRPLAKKILKIQSTHCVDNNSSDPKDCVQQCCENEYVNPKKICTATEFKSTNNHSCSYFDKKHYPTARDQFLQVETCENEYMFEDPDNLESKIYADEVCVECGKCKKKPKDYEIKENEKKEQTKKENKKIPKKQKIDDDQNVNPKKVPNDQKTDTVKNVNAKKKHYLEKDEWKFYKNTNCYNSKGADQISDHVGDVEECKSICQKSTTCEGFVYGDPSKCELRKNIVIGECEYSSYWQMYVKPKQNILQREQSEKKLQIKNEKTLKRAKTETNLNLFRGKWALYPYSIESKKLNGIKYHFKNKPLSSGGFGKVYEGIMVNNLGEEEKVAIKIQKNSTYGQLEENMMKELSGCNHIIQYKDSIIDGENIYIVMEYCSGGSLQSRLHKKMSEKDAQIIFANMVYGLKSIHEKDIIHFDLKPANIVFREEDNSTLKLIDFGLSKKCTFKIDGVCIRGTIPYMAPEILSKESVTKKSDIWSMGVLLYRMLFQRCPFNGDYAKDPNDLKTRIQGKLKFPQNTIYSKEVKNLISKMLKTDQDERFTLDDIMEHTWFLSNNEMLKKNKEEEEITSDENTIRNWFPSENIEEENTKARTPRLLNYNSVFNKFEKKLQEINDQFQNKMNDDKNKRLKI